jgi:hypothetical protein
LKRRLRCKTKRLPFSIYPTVGQAERAVDTLVIERFSDGDISVLLPDNDTSRDFAHQKHTKAPEGTTTGAVAGGTLGGALGLLAGIGALAIPGVSPFIAAGTIMGALAGVAVAARSEDLSAPSSAWASRCEAKRYEGRIRKRHAAFRAVIPPTDHARRRS